MDDVEKGTTGLCTNHEFLKATNRFGKAIDFETLSREILDSFWEQIRDRDKIRLET